MMRPPRTSTLFPYTPLFRSDLAVIARRVEENRERDRRKRREADAGERQARIDEDQQNQRRHGAEEIDRRDHAPAHCARRRQRRERGNQAADEAEGNDDEAEQEGLLQAPPDERQ